MRRVLLLVLLGSLPLHADVIIKSVLPEKHRIVIKNDDEMKVGDEIEAVSEMEETCKVKVTKVNGKMAAADTSQCSFASEFKVGQSLSGGGGGGGGGGGSSSHSGMKHYIGGNLYYAMADTIESTAKSGSTIVSVTDKGSSALGFGAQYKLEIGSIGLHAGFDYEMPREITERQVSNLPKTKYSPAPVLSLMLLELGGSYAFGPIVPFLGINYSMPTLTGAPALTVGGAFGIQAGVQWKITQMFAVDAAYRTVNFTVTESGTAYDSSRLWGIVVRGLVYFNIF